MAEKPSAENRLSCERPGCNVATDGLCLEDITPITDCSSLIVFPEEGADVGEETEAFARPVTSPLDDRVPLYGGGPLDLAEARQMVATRACGLVSVIGDQKAGKTTLLATLFELFHEGPFAGCRFAGTRTPRAFDERCHDATTASGRDDPDTVRTDWEIGLHFLHLAIEGKGKTGRVDLLFADRAGEYFEEIRKSDRFARELVELPHCKVVLMLVDGARLVDPGTRNGERHKVVLTARSLVQGNLLSKDALVFAVLTKLDEIVTDEGRRDDALAMFEDITKQLNKLAPTLRPIPAHKTAARAPDGSMDPGFGLDGLFEAILDGLGTPFVSPPTLPDPDVGTMTAYDLFALSARGSEG